MFAHDTAPVNNICVTHTLSELQMIDNKDKPEPLTMSVPAAGEKYYGLGRDGSYRAARRGDIPTVKVGRLLRVPVAAMERKLEQAK